MAYIHKMSSSPSKTSAEKDSMLPKFPQGKVWERCASFEPKPFTSSSARSWFQKVLCGAAHRPPSPSLTEGRPDLATPQLLCLATPQLLWTPDPAQCSSSQSKAGCSQPSPSHSRRVCDRITASPQLSFDPGSDQNSAFSRVTGPERSSECQMPG